MRHWYATIFLVVVLVPAASHARSAAAEALLQSVRSQYGRTGGLSLPKRKEIVRTPASVAPPPGIAGTNTDGSAVQPAFDPFKILDSLWFSDDKSGKEVKDALPGGILGITGSGKKPKDTSGRKDDKKPEAVQNGTKSLGVNENAPDGGKAPGLPTSEAPLRNGPNEPPPGGSGPPGQPLPKWLPTCILVDPSIPTGNEMIKGFAKYAAACGVVLEPYPFTIRGNYPNSPDTINNLAKTACNLDKILGVPFASVSTVVKYRDTAGIMCGDTENPESVAGCAELGKGPGGGNRSAQDQQKMQQAMKASGHFGGNVSGGVAANIVVPQGANADVLTHENGGHNWMGEPNGPAYGLGIGENGGGGASGGGFNAAGCAILAQSAYANDGSHFYDPAREIYYVKTDDARFQYDLMEGRSFFEGPPGLPPIPPPPPNRPPGNQPPAKPPPPSTPPKLVAVAPPPSKHQKPPAGGGPGAGAGNKSGDGPFFQNDFNFAVAGNPSRPGGSSGLGVNEQAKDPKALSSDFFEKGNNPGGGTGGSSLGVDEGAKDPNKSDSASDRLLSSVKDGSSGSSSTGGKKAEGETSLDGDGGEFFKAGAGEPSILESIVDATSELLDSEFFDRLFKKKDQPTAEPERAVRVIKELYK